MQMVSPGLPLRIRVGLNYNYEPPVQNDYIRRIGRSVFENIIPICLHVRECDRKKLEDGKNDEKLNFGSIHAPQNAIGVIKSKNIR